MNESSLSCKSYFCYCGYDTQDDFDYAEYLFQKILKPIDNTIMNTYIK
jgi:hypothetical protein